MEVYKNERDGVVEIWLTKQEQDCRQVRQTMKKLCAQHDGKYLVAVFLSGSEELAEQTSRLLCYNRKRLAQLESKDGVGGGEIR